MDVLEPPSKVQVVSEAARVHRRRYALSESWKLRSRSKRGPPERRTSRPPPQWCRPAGQSLDQPYQNEPPHRRLPPLHQPQDSRLPPLCVGSVDRRDTSATSAPGPSRFSAPVAERRVSCQGLSMPIGKCSRLCTPGEPEQPPPTPPNDRPLPEESDHRPHVTTQILGEWYAVLVDTGAAGSSIGDHLRDKTRL
jgi:hypothetical protein